MAFDLSKYQKKSLNPSQRAAREGFRGLALGVGALFDRSERFFVLQSIIIKKIPQTTPSHSGGLLTPVQIYHDCFIFTSRASLFAANKIWKNDCRKISCKWITRQKGTSSWGTSNTVANGKMNENREFHTHTTGVMNLALKLVIPAPNSSAEATVEVRLHDFAASDRPKTFFHSFPFCFRTSRWRNSFLTAPAATFHRTHGIPFSFADLIISHNFNHDFSLNSLKCSPTHPTPATNTSRVGEIFIFSPQNFRTFLGSGECWSWLSADGWWAAANWLIAE